MKHAKRNSIKSIEKGEMNKTQNLSKLKKNLDISIKKESLTSKKNVNH